ncbi:hypothetical protein ABPG72_022115 [Tetrahymena utriculariae]
MSQFSNYRNISIYNDQKQFKNDNEELYFAKNYNEKLYGKGKENNLKIEYIRPPESGFQNTVHSQYLSNNIKQYRDLKSNNPNYTSGNPITHQGKINDVFKPAIRRNEYSDIDNFNAANQMVNNFYTSPERDFKSSSKRIDVKPSESYEHFQKRELKTSLPYSEYLRNRNPIIQGDGTTNIQTKPRSAAGDQKVSNEYQRMQNNKFLLPSDRQYVQKDANTTSQIFFNNDSEPYSTFGTKQPLQSPSAQRVPYAHTGANCRDLLSGGYAENSRIQVTSKPTEVKAAERETKFGELNYYCDYRKRSNLLQKEEQRATNYGGVYKGKK